MINASTFEYLKSLEGWKKYHPTICVNSDSVFEDYNDVYTKNGNVFVIGLVNGEDMRVSSTVCLVWLNPNNITSIYVPQELKASVEDMPEASTSDFNWTSYVDDIIKGKNNYDIPFKSVRVLIDGNNIVLGEKFKYKGNLFQADVPVMDFGNPFDLSNENNGETFKTKRFISSADKVGGVVIPLTIVPYTSLYSLLPDEAKEFITSYLKNKGIDKGSCWTRPLGYGAGDRIFVLTKDEITLQTTKKYYISTKEENNTDPRVDHIAWKEITY